MNSDRCEDCQKPIFSYWESDFFKFTKKGLCKDHHNKASVAQTSSGHMDKWEITFPDVSTKIPQQYKCTCNIMIAGCTCGDFAREQAAKKAIRK